MPLQHLARDAQRVREFCDLLEALADELPRRSPAVWRQASRFSSTVLPDHFKDLSTVLLPFLAKNMPWDDVTLPTLKRLQCDCADCTACLPELTELLDQASRQEPAQMPPEALGYALRCFFAEVRRQIAWEETVVLPLAAKKCRETDLDALRLRLSPQGDRARLLQTVPGTIC